MSSPREDSAVDTPDLDQLLHRAVGRASGCEGGVGESGLELGENQAGVAVEIAAKREHWDTAVGDTEGGEIGAGENDRLVLRMLGSWCISVVEGKTDTLGIIDAAQGQVPGYLLRISWRQPWDLKDKHVGHMGRMSSGKGRCRWGLTFLRKLKIFWAE